jgi:anthranilate phosphoribosyltransferase
MSAEKSKAFGQMVTKLINSENMTRDESREMFFQILNNEQSDMHQGAFLAALTAKGATAEEIAGVWEAIYELDTVKVSPDAAFPLADNCGTGMDTLKTFNISTAASIIAAAEGVPMAKHGARAITSVCGTVDILEELGVDVECDSDIVKKSIEKAGIGIFNGMSPKVHPQALGRILSQISFGTVLNIAASLANPALPQYAVRGVYAREMLEPVALVMKEIGYKRALVIYGLSEDGTQGIDEASTLGETFVAELKEDGSIINYSFLPEEFGISRASREEIAPLAQREQEAVRLIAILSGNDEGACSDIVCLNAALILYLTDRCSSIGEGFQKAREVINSGRAMAKLRQWVEEQNHNRETGLSKLEKIIRQVAALQ